MSSASDQPVRKATGEEITEHLSAHLNARPKIGQGRGGDFLEDQFRKGHIWKKESGRLEILLPEHEYDGLEKVIQERTEHPEIQYPSLSCCEIVINCCSNDYYETEAEKEPETEVETEVPAEETGATETKKKDQPEKEAETLTEREARLHKRDKNKEEEVRNPTEKPKKKRQQKAKLPVTTDTNLLDPNKPSTSGISSPSSSSGPRFSSTPCGSVRGQSIPTLSPRSFHGGLPGPNGAGGTKSPAANWGSNWGSPQPTAAHGPGGKSPQKHAVRSRDNSVNNSGNNSGGEYDSDGGHNGNTTPTTPGNQSPHGSPGRHTPARAGVINQPGLTGPQLPAENVNLGEALRAIGHDLRDQHAADLRGKRGRSSQPKRG